MALSVLFFGTPHFAVPALKALAQDPEVRIGAVVTQPDRPAGRGKGLSASPVKQAAQELSIPVLQPERIKRDIPGFVKSLEPFGPFDMGVVIAFGQILPSEILRIPRSGCVNIHASLLPRWRGAAPIQRAVVSGDSETGVCLMKMDEGLDTGAVLAKATVPIGECTTSGDLFDSLANLGAELLLTECRRIVSGELIAAPQPQQGITYAEKIKSEEASIQWAQPARVVASLINGLSPAPGAFSYCDGSRVRFLRARAVPTNDQPMSPGTVHIQDGTMYVLCQIGKVEILQIQKEGKKVMTAEEFLRGNPYVAQMRFSSTQ